MEIKNLLITGLSGFWGEFFASYLDEKEDFAKIVGIDTMPPRKEFKRVKFREWNPINDSILKILEEEEIDGVCHLNFIPVKFHDEKMFQRNVLGSMNLLSACARMKIKKVVLKSSFIVYGAKGSNPNFLVESTPKQKYRFAYQENNDISEIDDYTTDFIRAHPDMNISLVRFCSVIGSTVNTPMTKYLSYPIVPSLLGFDPLFQFIHENDVLRALEHVLHSDVKGEINIAPPDVVPISKAQKICSQKTIPLLHPFAYSMAKLVNNMRLAKLRLLEVEFLRYNCILDTKKMSEALNFCPEKTGEETLREFSEHRKMKRLFPIENLKEVEDVTKFGIQLGSQKIKTVVEDQMQKFLNKRQIPTNEQLNGLSKKIDLISERLDKLAGKN